MFLRSEHLEHLKCDFCVNYLSCSPILITQNGKNMCGRCSPAAFKSESFYKNQAYENLASHVIFPCKNDINGCNANMKLNDVKIHEEQCIYNDEDRIICPSGVTEKDCSWNENIENIKKHFAERHQELIVPEPYCNKLDITKRFTRNVIIEAFEFLFLFQMKCLVTTGFLWHDVVYMGPKEYGKLFRYNLKINSGTACLTEVKDVNIFNLNHGFALDEKAATVDKLSNLRVLFDNGSVINFKLR